MVLELLSPPKVERQSDWSPHLYKSPASEFVKFHVPSGHNLLDDAEYASQAALWGIEVLLYILSIFNLLLLSF